MGLPWSDPELIEKHHEKKEAIADKKREVAKKFSPSGQRHEFDRKFKETGKANRFGYKEKFVKEFGQRYIDAKKAEHSERPSIFDPHKK